MLSLPNSLIRTQSAIRRRIRLGAAAVLFAAGAQFAILDAGAEDYRLSVGDVVAFDFVDDTLPPQELTVSNAGELSLPLIGGFKVAGLTVPEALKSIDAVFVERKIFIEPQVSLSVVSFHPIFVVGAVKAPGSFPFKPPLTVEQAVALAGGESAGAVTGEDRLITSAKLRGNLAENETEIARAAVAAARLTAQLAGRTEISPDDLAPEARDLASAPLLEALMVNERKILDTEHHSFETRHKQLTAATAEVGGALGNLEELAQKQKEVIASAHAEYDRAKILNKRGLKTLTDLAVVERNATAEEAHLLQIYNQTSTTRRELGELQRQLQELTDTRTRTALTALQDNVAEIKKLIASRRSIEEQILLLSNIAAEDSQKANMVSFTYQVRRKVDGRVETQSAAPDDPVRPGDIVQVSIDRGQATPKLFRPATELRLVQ